MTPELLYIHEHLNNPVYEVRSPKEVTSSCNELLRGKHGNPDWVIYTFNENGDLVHLKKMTDSLGDDDFAQIGFSINSTDINILGDIKDAEGLEINESPELEDLRKVTEDNFDEFQNLYENYMGSLSTQFTAEVVFELSKHQMTIEKDGQIIATLFEYPTTDCLNNEITQIAWVWVSSSLSQKDRSGVHYLISDTLKSRSNIAYQAGVNGRNNRSQSFFNKMGFVPKCVWVGKSR